MITYGCASTATDTGKVGTFSDGATTAKTFTLTCKNGGSNPEVTVNWKTLSADNDVYTVPPSTTVGGSEQSLSTTLGQTVTIGVFSTQDGGTAAAQGQVAAADWPKKWMEKSERVIGGKKLYEFVIAGATHVLSGNINNADPSTMYFFQSQVQDTNAATTIGGILDAGYRYVEIELHETTANSFNVGVAGFTTGATGSVDTLSTLTGALATFRGANGNEMIIINISATTAGSGVTVSHSNAKTHINADTELTGKFITRADKDSTYTTLKGTDKRYWVAYNDATTASGSTNLQDPITKTTNSGTDPASVVSGVAGALTAAPSAVAVAEFSMMCNRKDTCRSLITTAIATAAASKATYANVIAVDFATSVGIGAEAAAYSWIRATTAVSTSGAIRTFASVVAATVLSAFLLF